jgi:exopolysaccharide biosynthesis polyprenyl glycosylphosphotransferase
MIEARIKLYQNHIRLIDVISCLAAFVGSLYFTDSLPFIRSSDALLYLNERLFFVCSLAIPSIVVIHLVHLALFYVYKKVYYFPNIGSQIQLSAMVLAIDCTWIFLLQLFFAANLLPLLFYAYYFGSGLAMIILLRSLSNYCIKKYIHWSNSYINLLILGTNQRAYDFYRFIEENKLLGYNVIGFLDDLNYAGHDVPLIGDLEEVDRVLRENVIDRGVVFLPIRSYYDQIISIIDRAENQGIALQFMANIFQHKYGYMSPAIMGDFFGVLYDALPLDDWRLTVKRTFDITFALCLLLATLPVTLTAALGIKLWDGGPIFFSQVRVGYRKHRFNMYKFRSMVVGAEQLQSSLEARNEMTGPVFKIKNDPRVTWIGRLIRKYNIDELPQLINVILGDMSIVGPRPMAVRDYSGFSEDWLRRRFSVRPGLTCTWQCQKDRNDLSFEEWMRLDMDYIDNWNLMEDLKICLKTVVVVFSGSGR